MLSMRPSPVKGVVACTAEASPSRADLDLRPSLNTAYMRQINFCLERDLLLRQALLVPSRVTCYLAFASL
jgi:hypothetical protein